MLLLLPIITHFVFVRAILGRICMDFDFVLLETTVFRVVDKMFVARSLFFGVFIFTLFLRPLFGCYCRWCHRRCRWCVLVLLVCMYSVLTSLRSFRTPTKHISATQLHIEIKYVRINLSKITIEQIN